MIRDADSLGELVGLIREQAEACDLNPASWDQDVEVAIEDLRHQLNEIEESLIPYGLHVVGEVMPREDRLTLLQSISTAQGQFQPSDNLLERVLDNAQISELINYPELSGHPEAERQAYPRVTGVG